MTLKHLETRVSCTSAWQLHRKGLLTKRLLLSTMNLQVGMLIRVAGSIAFITTHHDTSAHTIAILTTNDSTGNKTTTTVRRRMA